MVGYRDELAAGHDGTAMVRAGDGRREGGGGGERVAGQVLVGGYLERRDGTGQVVAVAVLCQALPRPAGLTPGETFTEGMAWGGLKIALLKDGIFLRQRGLPQWWLPPLVIPWASIWKVHQKSKWWGYCLHLEINEEAGMMDLYIPQEHAQAFREVYDAGARARLKAARVEAEARTASVMPCKNQ